MNTELLNMALATPAPGSAPALGDRALALGGSALAPLEHLTIDIETVAGDVDDAEAWMRAQWCPSDKWKAETIGARYLEMLGKKRERLALIDASPIVVVSTCWRVQGPSQEKGVSLYHTLPGANLSWADVPVRESKTESEMLIDLRNELNESTCSDTVLVGHNIMAFDLPRLRHAYVRHNLKLPEILADPKVITFDSMRIFTRQFSVEGEGRISLSDLLDVLNIPNHKQLGDGGDVGRLYAEGKYEELLKYALLDVLAETEVYLRLTGQSWHLS